MNLYYYFGSHFPEAFYTTGRFSKNKNKNENGVLWRHFQSSRTKFTTVNSKVRKMGSIAHFYSLTWVVLGESCYHLMVDPKADLWQSTGLLQRETWILNAIYFTLARTTVEKTIIEDTLVSLLTILKQPSCKHFYILLDEFVVL